MRLWFLATATSLAAAYALGGRVSKAVSLLADVLKHSLSQGARLTRRFVQISSAYYQAGQLDEAHQYAIQALDHARLHQTPGWEAYALQLRSAISMHQSSPDSKQAEANFQRALSLAGEIGMRPLQAHCHRGLGTLYSQLGQSEQACAELSTAIELYGEMEMTFWLPETEATLSQVSA